jgi:hypothetical protein
LPLSEELSIGHKYPFNSCEILCSQNSFILDKLIERTKLADEDFDSSDFDNYNDSEDDEEKEEEEEEDDKDIHNDNLIDNPDFAFNSGENKDQHEDEDNKKLLVEDEKKNEDKEKKEEIKEVNDIKEIIINENKENVDIIANLNSNFDINFKENFKENFKDNNNENNDENNNENNINKIKEIQEKEIEIKSELNKEEKIIIENILIQRENDNNSNEIPKIEIDIKHDEDNNDKKDNKEKICNTKIINEEKNGEIKYTNEKNNFESKSKNYFNYDKLEESHQKFSRKKERCQKKKKEQIILNSKSSDSNKDEKEEKGQKDKKLKYKYIFPMLNQFFEFLENDRDLNYVLSGYFFKIFNNIYNKRGYHFLKYCFKNNSEILKKLIANIGRKSVCDCLHKLLTDNTLEQIIENSKEIKINILEEIFEKIEIFDSEALINLSDLLTDCFINKNFYILFISEKKICEKILELLNKLDNNNSINVDNKNEIFKCLLKIMNILNENILKDFGANKVTSLKNKNGNSDNFNDNDNDNDNEKESNSFPFNDIYKSMDDDFFNEDTQVKKITPEEDINIKLDKNFLVLSEISIKIIKDFIESDYDFSNNINNRLIYTTTFNQEKRLLGNKR